MHLSCFEGMRTTSLTRWLFCYRDWNGRVRRVVGTRFLLTRTARRRLIVSRLAVVRSADGDLVKA